MFTSIISLGIGLLTFRMNRLRPMNGILLMSRNILMSCFIGGIFIVPEIYYPFI